MLAAGRISIHVPLAGDDPATGHTPKCPARFLSTSPLRGTTGQDSRLLRGPPNFYPRPPCGGRRTGRWRSCCAACDFYPRPPCGGRLQTLRAPAPCQPISIHVPLAGDDNRCNPHLRHGKLFLSTSPLRGTTFGVVVAGVVGKFLSTSPLRGTTRHRSTAQVLLLISIHVPLAGDDAAVHP